MEEAIDHSQGSQTDVVEFQGIDERPNGFDHDFSQGTTAVRFRPLYDFFKYHVSYIGLDSDSEDNECPICRQNTSESHERMIQIDLPTCHHIFGADCFERYVQRSHTCPLCRELWFEERLPPETSAPRRQLLVQISVANQELADALVEALDHDNSELVRNILRNHITEYDAGDQEDTDQTSTDEEESESGSEISGSPLSANRQLHGSCMMITSDTVTETENEVNTESDEVQSSRIATQSSMASDGLPACDQMGLTGDNARISDHEGDVERPRQRRRYK